MNTHTPARKTYACQACIEPSVHTPGPWKATHRGAGGWAISNSVWVEYLRSSGLTKADAHLIAKAPIAPKLAEALRACVNAITHEIDSMADDEHPMSIAHRKARDKGRAALAEWDKEA